MSNCPDAPATLRNREAILAVLLEELPGDHKVLEIGSGTGQHAVHFASALPGLVWQTSDLSANHAGILQWIEAAALPNVLKPLNLDVSDTVAIDQKFDAIFSANTAHIMSADSVVDMISLAGRLLAHGGKFLLYGPFKLEGRFTSESNQQFDESLRAQDPAMGIRDLEWIDKVAGDHGLLPVRRFAMPANNMLVVWSKTGDIDR